jgi:hypothetical protein
MPVCTEAERLPGAEFDHWYSRNQNRVTQTWLVCAECNRQMLDTDFKSGARSAFESYQTALRPFLGGRRSRSGSVCSPASGWGRAMYLPQVRCNDSQIVTL